MCFLGGIRMKKLVFLLILLMFLTGCSTSYSIIIDDNFKVREEIVLLDDGNTLKKSDVSSLINKYVDNDDDTYDIVDFNVNKKSLVIFNYDDNYGVYTTNNYGSLEEYNFSSYVYTFFEKVDIVKKSNNYIIYLKSFMYDVYDDYVRDNKFNINNDVINFKIEVPYVVYENNASYKSGNTYGWEINRNNSKDIEIILNFSLKDKSEYKNVGTFIPSYDTGGVISNVIDKVVTNKTNGWYVFFFVIFIIFILGIVIFSVKVRKKNRL